MSDLCQCSWHHLEYCYLCEEAFEAHQEQKDLDEDIHQVDAAYFSHIGDAKNPPRLMELAETLRQDTADQLMELSHRLELGTTPVAIHIF